jgi:hypothetical protein
LYVTLVFVMRGFDFGCGGDGDSDVGGYAGGSGWEGQYGSAAGPGGGGMLLQETYEIWLCIYAYIGINIYVYRTFDKSLVNLPTSSLWFCGLECPFFWRGHTCLLLAAQYR